MFDPLLYEQDGRIVTLTLNQPETRNALSDEIVEALVAAVDRINADLGVGCVIITGAGEGFSSGGNVKDMRDRVGLFGGIPAQARRGYLYGIQRIPMAMYALEAPIIAAVNGAAVGAGCDLTTMCDIRIANRKARFAESFLRVGLVSGDGGAWFLPRVVGMSKATEMTLTGDFLDAEEALACGLVSRVVDDAELMPTARKLAEKIARQPVHSQRLNKRLLRESQQVPLHTALEMAAAMQSLAQATHDQHESVLAFLDKRHPQYEDR